MTHEELGAYAYEHGWKAHDLDDLVDQHGGYEVQEGEEQGWDQHIAFLNSKGMSNADILAWMLFGDDLEFMTKLFDSFFK